MKLKVIFLLSVLLLSQPMYSERVIGCTLASVAGVFAVATVGLIWAGIIFTSGRGEMCDSKGNFTQEVHHTCRDPMTNKTVPLTEPPREPEYQRGIYLLYASAATGATSLAFSVMYCYFRRACCTCCYQTEPIGSPENSRGFVSRGIQYIYSLLCRRD